jgi:predicted PolB exonuclease-like 3'-5' exonuclease
MVDIKKMAFIDIETVGAAATLDELFKTNPRQAQLWDTWTRKMELDPHEDWLKKAGLQAEYGKIVCVSFGYYDANMQPKIQSFYGDDEHDILEKTAKVLNNSDNAGYKLAGHNIEKFDVPFLWKRMFIHGITPPDIITIWDKKPWDLKFFDTAKVWGNGYWKESFTSLETLSLVLGVDSSKDEMHGNEVHNSYWNEGGIEKIKTYCEKDVLATMEVARKIYELLPVF